ncbi:MAG: cysteine--tRNA ligase [bacterium]|jgi:cysteinyl-tRNA synthetase|nr:cysteine--tRNA ligase [bacterium]MDD3805718.1 cysteine--tRNA ligase [bacterium]MDD4558700.1 cysteine--tRNA ligase [bacterium]
MPLRLYNTMTGRKEELVPARPGSISMYVCGVTPYDYSHLGHARAYVTFDVVKRYLQYSGYEVYHVQNFTDIDDKIIKRATQEGIDAGTLAQRYIDAYFEDMDALGIIRASVYPRVTEHIDAVVEMVAVLQQKSYAYEVDGDVYFDVARFKEYGALSGRDLEEMRAGARVEINELKHSPLDFVLWKRAKDGEPAWQSPWGPGRPGWHIECSAMSLKYLGCGFDIHGGGQDLIFPHHENEIAQSEAYAGCSPFARYWMHNGFVTIDKEKMSKSLGNFFTIRQILERYEAEVVRYYLVSVHYRSPIDFSDERLEEAKRALERLRQTRNNLTRALLAARSMPELQPVPDFGQDQPLERLTSLQKAFNAAMDDDFNTAGALAALHSLAGEANRVLADPNPAEMPGATILLQSLLDSMHHMGDLLGILREETGITGMTEELMDLLIEVRKELRTRKLWDLSDLLRDRLQNMGIALEDRPEGTIWRKL